MYRPSLGTRGETRRAAAEAETALVGRVRPWTWKSSQPCPLAPHVLVSRWVRAPDPPPSPVRKRVNPSEGDALIHSTSVEGKQDFPAVIDQHVEGSSPSKRRKVSPNLSAAATDGEQPAINSEIALEGAVEGSKARQGLENEEPSKPSRLSEGQNDFAVEIDVATLKRRENPLSQSVDNGATLLRNLETMEPSCDHAQDGPPQSADLDREIDLIPPQSSTGVTEDVTCDNELEPANCTRDVDVRQSNFGSSEVELRSESNFGNHDKSPKRNSDSQSEDENSRISETLDKPEHQGAELKHCEGRLDASEKYGKDEFQDLNGSTPENNGSREESQSADDADAVDAPEHDIATSYSDEPMQDVESGKDLIEHVDGVGMYDDAIEEPAEDVADSEAADITGDLQEYNARESNTVSEQDMPRLGDNAEDEQQQNYNDVRDSPEEGNGSFENRDPMGSDDFDHSLADPDDNHLSSSVGAADKKADGPDDEDQVELGEPGKQHELVDSSFVQHSASIDDAMEANFADQDSTAMHGLQSEHLLDGSHDESVENAELHSEDHSTGNSGAGGTSEIAPHVADDEQDENHGVGGQCSTFVTTDLPDSESDNPFASLPSYDKRL